MREVVNMPNLYGVEIAKIKDEVMFEELCLDIFKNDENYENVQKNGSRGQEQDGVDVFARKVMSQEWIGVQCKVKTGGKITQNEINLEIDKAKEFNPKLTHYYIYTTAKRDAKIQEFVRKLTDDNLKSNLFDVQILFWEDIETLLREDKNQKIHYKYYKGYYSKIKQDGYAEAKLLSLTVSYHFDKSYYEIMIGRVHRDGNDDCYGLNYWKNVNFIMNMNQRAFETFPARCFPSDIEMAFPNKRDAFIISNWLNTLGDIDKFLQTNEVDFNYEIPHELFMKYLDRHRDEDEEEEEEE
jgi:hypothetical protein